MLQDYEKKGDAGGGVFGDTLPKNVAVHEKSSSAFLECVCAAVMAGNSVGASVGQGDVGAAECVIE